MSKTRTIYVSTVVASAFGFGAGLLFEILSKDKKRFLGASTDLEGNSKLSTRLSPGAEHFKSAIQKSRDAIKIFKEQVGTPSIIVGVSVDGNTIWEEGTGLSNVENGTQCHPDTKMRIASISKPIAVALLAKLWEKGFVDLDKSIQDYVPYFPQKQFNKEVVKMTTRQLASHTAGVRHYKKKAEDNQEADGEPEFYLKERFTNLEKSIDLFKDDEILFKPGSGFTYTTHGYTLLSAVIEKAGSKPFTEQIQHLFKLFGLKNTYLDEVDKVIANRASYYAKSKKGQLVNAELTDNSYKWAGGGLVSTVGDLLKFGNAMLYCYQQDGSGKPGYLKKATVEELWTPVDKTAMKWGRDSGYGLGWVVVPTRHEFGGVPSQQFYVGHGGGAVGASSVLVVVPPPRDVNNNPQSRAVPPAGVVVAVLVNLEGVSCHNLARDIADLFQGENSQPV